MEGLDDPSIVEFINHPSYRQVATFFLGFVFISCIHYTSHLPLAAARRIRSYCLGRRQSQPGGRGLEANRPPGDEKVHGWLSSHRTTSNSSSLPTQPESNNLSLSMTLCFAMASVADFGSLLVFDANKGIAGCAFLVAWGGMAAQAARLVGLLKLSLDLKKMGVRKWETFLFWGWLIFALVVMFVSNAISIGTTRTLDPNILPNSALCYRKHFLGTAVVSSVVDIVLEAYCLIRIYYLVVPAFLSPRHKLDALMDVRAARASSLLVLDLMSAAPAAHFFNIVADFVPASIGALLVLVAFNHRSPDVSLASTASIPGTRRESLQSRSTIEIKKMPSTRSLADPRQRISHPFAASALQDPAPETEDWPESASPEGDEKPYIPYPEPAAPPPAKRQTWRSSNQSMASDSDSEVARSVKGAVVGFAFKDVLAQGRRQRDRRSFLPELPTMSEGPHQPLAGALPRSTPLRIPRPTVATQPYVDILERASRLDPDKPVPALPGPQISITSATPVTPGVSQSPYRPNISITVPSESNESAKSSLHLTPSTPARSQPSQRASSESNVTGEWRFDSRHDSFGSHRSSDESSPTQAHRQSAGSSRFPPADDDLSIVYEASHEDSDSMPPSRAYRPTFGEHMFVQGGIGRPISTPVSGVPEDVGPTSNGSPSSGENSKPRSSPTSL